MRSIGIVRLILVLLLLLPASFLLLRPGDYSGRLKIERVSTVKRKSFIGYHFLKCRQQIVDCLKNKKSYKDRSSLFGEKNNILFENQCKSFLVFKEKLSSFWSIIQFSLKHDMEELMMA